MDPEGSLTRLQELANSPYSEPYQSSPCPPSYFLNIYFNIILPSISGSSKWTLSLRIPHRNPLRNYSLPNLMFLWPCIMNWPYKTTNVMQWILFIRQILLLSSTCFEYQVLIFRRTVVHKQHMVPSLFIRVLVSCWYAAIGRTPYSCISTRH